MNQKSIKSLSILLTTIFLAMTVFVLPAMTYNEDPPGIKIAPIGSPLETLPELPERTETKVKTHVQALTIMKAAKQTMEELGGQIDIAHDAVLDCNAYLNQYREVAALPILDATGSDDWTKHISNQYNEAVANILETSHDMYLHCGKALKGTADHGEIPFQNWGFGRWGITKSVGKLEEAINPTPWITVTVNGNQVIGRVGPIPFCNADYKIALYALTDIWYVQPYGDWRRDVQINSDCTWKSDIHTWSKIAVHLVTASYQHPSPLGPPSRPCPPLDPDTNSNVLATSCYP